MWSIVRVEVNRVVQVTCDCSRGVSPKYLVLPNSHFVPKGAPTPRTLSPPLLMGREQDICTGTAEYYVNLYKNWGCYTTGPVNISNCMQMLARHVLVNVPPVARAHASCTSMWRHLPFVWS